MYRGIPSLYQTKRGKKLTKLPYIKSVEAIAKSKLFNIEKIELIFSNSKREYYEKLSGQRTGGVMVVPLTQDQTVLLIREYSVGFERYELGFVKGGLEKGELAEDAANREMREEVGYAAKEFILLKNVSVWPNYSSFETSIFMANRLYRDPLIGDEPEEIEILEWPVKNLDALRSRKDFTDARSLLATYLIQDYIKNK